MPAKTPNNTTATPATAPAIAYDSNPFTISIRGFQLLIKYAQSVVITILIIGLFGFLANLISQIVPVFFDDSTSTTTTTLQANNSLEEGLRESVELNNNAVSGDQEVTLNFEDESVSVTTDDVTAGDVWKAVGIGLGVLLIFVFITVPIMTVFSAAYKGFIAAGTVAAMQQRSISFGEAFSEMAARFGTLFLSELLATLKIIGGYLLLIVPGIRAQLRYEALPYVVLWNKEIGARDAVNTTKDLYRGHLMEVYGIKFFASIIPAIGQAFSAGGIGLSLQQITAYKQANLATPKAHWLNYIGLIIILGILGFFAIMGIIIATIVIAT